MSDELMRRVKGVAEKLAAREAAKKAVIEKHKPAKGKKLTAEQRLTRIEELLGIVDE